LARAIAPYHLTERDVHDVLNIFQIAGHRPEHEIYFTEPSPAKKGTFLSSSPRSISSVADLELSRRVTFRSPGRGP
jgi:hypothetical protein